MHSEMEFKKKTPHPILCMYTRAALHKKICSCAQCIFWFWFVGSAMEHRVDEINSSKSKIILLLLYLTHHLPAITEFKFFGGHPNVHLY